MSRNNEKKKTSYERAKKEYLISNFKLQRLISYTNWLELNYPNKKTLNEQKKLSPSLKIKPKFSIIIPIYKTPLALLIECMDSALNQTYENFEVCVVDDNSQDKNIKRILNNYKEKYNSKIQLKFRTKNGHISIASNDAIDMANGDFIVLLDHDDILWPNALYELATAINNNPKANLIYTDEDKINKRNMHVHPFLKPEYNKLFLESCNYITHLAAIKTDLIKSLKGFRVGLDGAQDWDLFLRVSEKTSQIVHVPKILYSWRLSDASTSNNGFKSKPYAYEAQRKTIMEYCKRNDLKIKDAILPKGYVGWQLVYDLDNTQIGVVIAGNNSSASVYGIIRRIEDDAKKFGLETIYMINEKTIVEIKKIDKKLVTNLKIVSVNINTTSLTFSKVDDLINSKYILALSNIDDISGEEGWLNNAIGCASRNNTYAVALTIKNRDHSIHSSGLAYDQHGRAKKLLSGYIAGTDQRFDTMLFSCRYVEAPDIQGFLYRADRIPAKIKHHQVFSSHIECNKQHLKTVLSPYASLYLPNTAHTTSKLHANLPLSEYTGTDYLFSNTWNPQL